MNSKSRVSSRGAIIRIVVATRAHSAPPPLSRASVVGEQQHDVYPSRLFVGVMASHRGSTVTLPQVEPRVAHLNDATRNAELIASKHYAKNVIVTSKYTAVSFVPKTMFEFFRVVANVYFLVISLLQVRSLPSVDACVAEAPTDSTCPQRCVCITIIMCSS